MLIDSHCHLNHDRLRHIGDVSQIVENAKDNNVQGLLTICCRIHQELETLTEIANQNENVWFTIGTHPHDAGDDNEMNYSLDDIVNLTKTHDKIVGIGESGLDYYYKNSEPDDQQTSFRKHIRVCLETDLPLVVHAREADDDIIRIIKEESAGQTLKGVMHCFSSGRKMGEEALEIGFYISFSGMVTFKKLTDLQDFAKDVPLDRILVETDAPYLAPEPYRGKINQPAYVTYTAEAIAKLKSETKEEIAKHCHRNFFTLFDRAKLS